MERPNNNSCQDYQSNKDDFDRNGFVGPIDVLSVEEATQALHDVQNELSLESIQQKQVEERKIPTNNNNLNNSLNTTIGYDNDRRFKLHLVLPSLDRIAHHPTIVALVEQILDSKHVLLWSSDVNTKPPFSGGYYATHQDSTYAGLQPASKCVTVWIALSDPVTEREGCLSFYKRSHLLGQLPHYIQTDSTGTNNNNNMLSLGQYIPDDIIIKKKIGNGKPTSVELRAGQITIHSFLTVHCSGPNRSSKPRTGFALRYIDGSLVKQTKTTSVQREMVTIISSSFRNVKHGGTLLFDIESRLSENPTPQDIHGQRLVRKEAMEREITNYFLCK
jgi:ectoine hydroxylase-related dioxygenase (phytanoyl-CoA dioxygenase family)